MRGVSAVPSVQVGSGLLSIRYGPGWPVGSSQVDRVLTTIPDGSKTAVVISALLFTHLLELLDPESCAQVRILPRVLTVPFGDTADEAPCTSA